MMKLLIDRYLECMSLPVFFSISLIHSMMYLFLNMILSHKGISIPFIIPKETDMRKT